MKRCYKFKSKYTKAYNRSHPSVDVVIQILKDYTIFKTHSLSFNINVCIAGVKTKNSWNSKSFR